MTVDAPVWPRDCDGVLWGRLGMTEGRERFARQLEDAAENISDVPRHELQVLLRRAALRVRNIDRPPVSLDDEYRALINTMNGDDPGAA